MAGITNLIDTLGLRKLFTKAEGGDLRAKEAIKAFQDSPELTEMFQKKPQLGGDIGLAQLPPIQLPQGPARPGLNSFTSNPTSPQNGVGGAFPGASGEGKPPTNWGNVASRAGIALSGIANSLNPRTYQEPGGVTDARQRLQADQMAQLERRHKMWGMAYDDSQTLPPEVLSDPKFASLAQAKAAFDKDMMDGKVDNEKNVSLFLTELARYKPELDELSLLTKKKAEVDVAGKLQNQMIDSGQLMNFEGGLVDPQTYARLAGQRTENEKKLEYEKERTNLLDARYEEEKKRVQANTDRSFGLQERRFQELETYRKAQQAAARANKIISGLQQTVKGAMGAKDPSTGEAAGASGLLNIEGALIDAAGKLGINFNKNVYAALTPEERQKALYALASKINSSGGQQQLSLSQDEDETIDFD